MTITAIVPGPQQWPAEPSDQELSVSAHGRSKALIPERAARRAIN